MPATLARPLSGRAQRRQDLDRRRLAGAVRAEQREDGPGRRAERQPVERAHVLAVGLGQIDGLDRGGARIASRRHSASSPPRRSRAAAGAAAEAERGSRATARGRRSCPSGWHRRAGARTRARPRASRCGTRSRPRRAAATPAGRRDRTTLRSATSAFSVAWMRSSSSASTSSGGRHGKQREPGLELRELLGGRREHLAQPVDQLDAAGVEQLVDRPLGAPALALGLLRLDQPRALERLHDRVERAVVELDALVLAALAHGRRHLVRMHRALLQAGEHRKGEGIGSLRLRHRILGLEYTPWTSFQVRRETAGAGRRARIASARDIPFP